MATAISFPPAPNPGDTYTYMSATYVWTGAYWRVSSLGSTYVPYVGATADLNLGSRNISANNLTFTTKLTNQGGVGVLAWPVAGATLTIPTGGGTLGTAAFTNIGAYEVPLTFSDGLTRTLNAVKNDLITGKAGGQNIYGGIAQKEGLTLNGNIATASGTDIAGGNVIIKATAGTGIGESSIDFYTGTTLGSGTTLQTSSKKMSLLGNGNLELSSSKSNAGVQYKIINTNITQGSYTSFYMKTGSAGSGFEFYKYGSNGSLVGQIYGVGINNYDAGAMWFSTANTIRLFISASSDNIGIGSSITTPTAGIHIRAGTATASTGPLKFTSGTLLTASEAGAMEFLTDDYYLSITTSNARKKIVLDDGVNLISGRLAAVTTNGRLTNAPDLSGSGNRVVQADTSGVISATNTVVTGKLSDAAAIALLINDANWTLGLYTGAAITLTFEGQYYKNDDYYFTAYSDNDWIRKPRA